MPRYSLRLRDKYGPNELTGPEQLQQGIGKFLGNYVQRQDAQRAERNTIGEAGGEILPDDPSNSIRGRWDKVKRGIGSLLGRHDQMTSEQRDGLSPSYTDIGGFARPVPNIGNMGIMPGDLGTPRPSTRTPFDEKIPAHVTGNPNTIYNEEQALFPNRFPRPVSSSPAPAEQSRSAIGAALGGDESYTYEGQGGLRARMPNVRGKARIAAETKTFEQHAEQERQIESLVQAGMDPSEARARVLNNVVRYDETFGQQRGGAAGARGGMTQAERLEIQDRLDKRASASRELQRQLAGIRSGDTNKRMQLTDKIAELNAQQRADLALLRSEQQEATTATNAATRIQTDPIASSTPAGQQAAAAATATAEAARGRVAGARAKVAQTPLTAEQKARAKTDPNYRRFLESKGYRVP